MIVTVREDKNSQGTTARRKPGGLGAQTPTGRIRRPVGGRPPKTA